MRLRMPSTRVSFGRAACCGVARLRRTGKVSAAVGSSAAWAGADMASLGIDDIAEMNHATPLAVVVQYWYPNPGISASRSCARALNSNVVRIVARCRCGGMAAAAARVGIAHSNALPPASAASKKQKLGGSLSPTASFPRRVSDLGRCCLL